MTVLIIFMYNLVAVMSAVTGTLYGRDGNTGLAIFYFVVCVCWLAGATLIAAAHVR